LTAALYLHHLHAQQMAQMMVTFTACSVRDPAYLLVLLLPPPLLLLLLLQVNKLVREIEVSHWGNIYVEESYEIVSQRASLCCGIYGSWGALLQLNAKCQTCIDSEGPAQLL
jgi:hypothetical protein